MSMDAQDSRTGLADGPPRPWQRHDLVVVFGALALLAAGRLAYHSLAQPDMMELTHEELRLLRPSGWLPAMDVDDAPAPLASGVGEGQDAGQGRRGDVHHVMYKSPADATTRLEVRVAPRPRHGNLTGAIALLRQSRYGEMYRSSGTEVVSIGNRAWLRTRFRYAYKPDKQAAPRIAMGIEYSTTRGARLYSVTFHGEESIARRLADLIAPTLLLTGEGDAASQGDQGDQGEVTGRPAGATAPGKATARAMQATVMIVAVDRVGGELEPVSGGSGVIVASDGSVLTSAHVVHDEQRGVLHDLFVIGRFRAADREPDLVCAGRPEEGYLDLDLDLALLRCSMDMDGRAWAPRHWPAIALGRSDTLIPGEPIQVLGFPDRGGGILQVAGGEVTGWTGANSAGNDRDGRGSGKDYVKTSAEISAGSSGGPVINEEGALIGVATAYRVRTVVRKAPGSEGAGQEAAAGEPGKGPGVMPGTGPGPGGEPGLEPGIEIDREEIGLVRPVDRARSLLALVRLESSSMALRAESAVGQESAASSAVPADARAEDARAEDARADGHKPPSGVIVTSKVVDAANDQPIAGAMVIVFAPGVDTRDLDLHRLEQQAMAWGLTDEDGEFLLQEPIPRGERYTVAVLAEDYHPLTGDGALALAADTPDLYDPWGIIRLARK